MTYVLHNKTPADRIAEIQTRYRNGELRHKIAKSMGIGESTVFKYCEDVYLPGSKSPLSPRNIRQLMVNWR